MSTTDPLLTTIEPDEVASAPSTQRQGPQREQVTLTPTNHAQNTSASDMEAGERQYCILPQEIPLTFE